MLEVTLWGRNAPASMVVTRHHEYNEYNAYTTSWWNLKSAIYKPSWTRFQPYYHKDVCGAHNQLVVHVLNRKVKGLIKYNIKVQPTCNFSVMSRLWRNSHPDKFMSVDIRISWSSTSKKRKVWRWGATGICACYISLFDALVMMLELSRARNWS